MSGKNEMPGVIYANTDKKGDYWLDHDPDPKGELNRSDTKYIRADLSTKNDDAECDCGDTMSAGNIMCINCQAEAIAGRGFGNKDKSKLVEALQKAREYVKMVHDNLSIVAPQNNCVTPDLTMIDQALAEHEAGQ